MNGAENLIAAAEAAGLDLCLANPGTTELPLVAALDRSRGIRVVLALFEGVASGAADGYARMRRRPALVLLHLGPGLGNAVANLHNARRAFSPVIALVGDHATWHRPFDPPLASDIEGLAAPVSKRVEAVGSAKEAAAAFARLLEAACAPPPGPVTLILPADAQWEDAGAGPIAASAPGGPGGFAVGTEPQREGVGAGTTPPAGSRAAEAEGTRTRAGGIEALAEALRSARRPALLLGGEALLEEGLREAARLAAAGFELLCETFPPRLERGGHLPAPERLPYFPEAAAERLREVSDLVLAGAAEPVAFFGYRGGSSRIVPPACRVHPLCKPGEAAAAPLRALADALEAPERPAAERLLRGHDPQAPPSRTPRGEPPGPGETLTPRTLGAVVASLQPEGAIVVDEAATSGLPYFLAAAAAPRHTYLALTGGAIGMGLPLATGAALACPDRPVIALEADGSALYTLQALWTQAREGLDVTTILCSNRAYRILQVEMGRAGVRTPGAKAASLLALDRPPLDWVALARGQGVPAERVGDPEALARALGRALAEPGPHLIEAVLP